MNFFEKLKNGLSKTKSAVSKKIDSVFSAFVKIDEDLFDELEETLIEADMGVETTEEVLDELRARLKEKHITEPDECKNELVSILSSLVGEGEALDLSQKPSVILVIGVNGVGKTTSIAKITNYLKNTENKKVVLAAADTFRAAAIDQLAVWAQRLGVDLIKQSEGSDPAAVVYDAACSVKNKNADVLIVDTAGRLHNKKNLMEELKKIDRVIDRELPGASRETLLVLDATTGQNAVVQAKEFGDSANITGIVLTKLDGTAKGGIIFSIKKELGLPVKFIGVGEQADDMQPFVAKDFVKALFDNDCSRSLQ
ncbi:MAG: signal recognition particle-docking protein FtsY [Clostridia bacterium]|nr:signal recognition particle-docking protein FtsY [Clostridia bacterium]